MTTAAAADPGTTNAHYGDKVTTVEPGGIERISPHDRHGTPTQLLWTWSSPNLEFATVFVGVISISYFGQSFWAAVLALVMGSALGGLSHGVLSSWGPKHGLAQMVLSRSAFGYWGNLLPAGLNAIMAGIGWFAVNSVSGALALAALTSWSPKLTLVIIVLLELGVGFWGHNLVHAFEKYAFPILVLFFALGSIAILAKSHPGAGEPAGGIGGFAGFTLTFSAAFGYAAGWNPYGTDYTRYLPIDTSPSRVGWMAGLGNAVSCSLLTIVGAASVTVGTTDTGNPTDNFTAPMPTLIAKLILLGIALGAVSANAVNIYSSSMSFLAMGIKMPGSLRRAVVGIGFGLIGFILAWNGLKDAGDKYENFLLVIAYWIAPWLGVVFTDRILRRGTVVDDIVVDSKYQNWAGPISMLTGIVISIWLFSNQSNYAGPVAKSTNTDLTLFVGFAIAAVLYLVLFTVLKPAAPTDHIEVAHHTPV